MSLAACGDEPATNSPANQQPATTSVRPSQSQAAQNELTVEVRASEKAPAKTWRLNCDPAGGDHPKAKEACAAIAKAKAPFAAPPKDQMCTKIYGGPEIATVKGTWQGRPVDAKFTRGDGCALHRWTELSPVFGDVPKVR